MNPNFVVYLNVNDIDAGCKMVKNLQKCGYAPMLSDSQPRLSDLKVLSGEHFHHGLIFNHQGFFVLPRDFNTDLSEVAVVLWYNYDMKETDLRALGAFFTEVLINATEPEFDYSNGLLKEFIQKPSTQISSKMEIKEKRKLE